MDSNLIIFTYAPAGLGHLRVTDALYEALPKEVKPLILGSQDKRIAGIHRITSVHPLLRRLMEWIQQGSPEDLFTTFYRWWLRSHSKLLKKQLLTLLGQHMSQPQKVVIISTHFGLAHQVAAIKKELEHEKKIEIKLVVQVTDDSPQHIWFVPGSDLIFVPSKRTKIELNRYREEQNLRPVKMIVSPYPTSPKLAQLLSSAQLDNRTKQLLPDSQQPINFSIPISGAAVGLEYFTKLVNQLGLWSERYQFSVVARYSTHTKQFLKTMAGRTGTQIFAAKEDQKVVDDYEQLYQQEVVSLEITKPSEQAFKALLEPTRVGGSVLLFSQPVGRQEYDNLDFLIKHRLIPSKKDQQSLWDLAATNSSLGGTDWLNKATSWRGIRMMADPVASANFIHWCLKQGLFAHMSKYRFPDRINQLEVSPNGAVQFWEKVLEVI